ncbi:hypothetical protein [Muricoccus radiodurans]|uniref:hypothetical protein n=1 Tax=Muricoccus radiodurans TaxID=2231721 RepID=UPI003CEF9840
MAATAYLLAPALLFLGSWAQPWIGVSGVVAGLAALALTRGWRVRVPLDTGAAVLCLTLGLVWAAATGAHHLVYATADWEIRDAVLHDLSAGPWPVAYRDVAGGAETLLRAPLGFYLPAGLVGRAMGFHVAQAALWAWTGLGLGLVLTLLATIAREAFPGRRGAAVTVAGLFVLFGGLDILPNMWLDAGAGIGPFGSWGRGGEWWARLFQYSGHVTALLWAPNHALPAWLVALLLLRHGRNPEFLRGAALPLAGGAFWSPVATAGAAVLVVASALRQGGSAILRAAVSPVNWLGVALAVPVCLYLVAGSAAVRHEALLSAYLAGRAIGIWALFLMVEVLCWAALAAVLVRGWLFGVSVAMLCLLPAYIFGPGNEMTSRGGLAPLAVLAVMSAVALLAPAASRAQQAARGGLVVCAVLATLGSAMEGSLLVAKRPWAASDHCSFPEAARQSVFEDSTDWSHYLAPWPEATLRGWMRDPVRRDVPPPGVSPPCWTEGGP